MKKKLYQVFAKQIIYKKGSYSWTFSISLRIQVNVSVKLRKKNLNSLAKGKTRNIITHFIPAVASKRFFLFPYSTQSSFSSEPSIEQRGSKSQNVHKVIVVGIEIDARETDPHGINLFWLKSVVALIELRIWVWSLRWDLCSEWD